MVNSVRHSHDGGISQGQLALLTTDEFVAELHQRLAVTCRAVAIQLMTFDGDASGLAVARLLVDAAGRGVQVRLLVDSFALRFVSDRPVGRRDVRAEFRATLAMFDELRAAGVEMRFTNPNGPLRLFALARNHKKLYVIDDVVYLGGVNVSDHNFSWHDFMVRVTDRSTRDVVLADFDATFAGRRQTVGPVGPAPGPERAVAAGIVTNKALERVFDQLVRGARQRVVVASPYALDRGLARALEASPAATKTVVIAARNNFRFFRLITPYLARRLARAGVELASYGRFSHSKFLLVDDDYLLLGSSNFGRHSFWCNQEIGLVIRDAGFVGRFEAELLAGLGPVQIGGGIHRVWAGALATAATDTYLRLYARVVAPHVSSLDARRSERR
jgi:cardiolipin synthase